MRVLLCERNFAGHRKAYMNCLSEIKSIVFYYYAPTNINFPTERFYKYNIKNNKSLMSYLVWIRSIRKIVKDNNIDVVHILDGDSILRFFGLGLNSLGSKKQIITYHHFFNTPTKRIAYSFISRSDLVKCVVHTEEIKRKMNMINISNVFVCNYPSFDYYSISNLNPIECKDEYGVNINIPTIGIIGGMNSYKNILDFLNILEECEENFQLLICGKPSDITEAEINKAIKPYKNKVFKKIKVLTDSEYQKAIVASDIIYSMYSIEFDGASGPMIDGVCARKIILASDHGSLGFVVKEKCLGYVADVRNKQSVLENTKFAIIHAFNYQYNTTAEKYREEIRPEVFQETYEKIYNWQTANN